MKNILRGLKNNKYISILLSICLVASLCNTLTFASPTDPTTVTGGRQSQMSTGTSPFDSDNAAGHDADPDNAIVRSFDSASYSFEITLHRPDTATGSWSETVTTTISLNAKFSEAKINLAAMPWFTPDSNGLVENGDSQSVTGTFVVSSDTTANELTFGQTIPIQVLGSSNGQVLNLTSSFEISGQSSPVNVAFTPITVSATPRLNVKLSPQSGALKKEVAYNTQTGDTFLGTKSETDLANGWVNGYIYTFTTTLQLYNTDTTHQMRGIELPTGTISYDLRYTYTKNDTTNLVGAQYTPFLWDYRLFDGTKNNGQMRRKMDWGDSDLNNLALPQNYSPIHSNTSEASSIRNQSGDITAMDYGNGTIGVNLDDYSFENFDFQDFPTKDFMGVDSKYGYNQGIGAFNAGLFQIFVPALKSEDLTSTDTLKFTLTDANLSANTKSSQRVNNDDQIIKTDDSFATTVGGNSGGQYAKYTQYEKTPGTPLASTYNAGDSVGYREQKLYIAGYVRNLTQDNNANTYISDVDLLQKFDGSAFEPTGNTHTNYTGTFQNSHFYYVAKADGKNWANDEELQNGSMHEYSNLRYYSSLQALKDSGAICVGFLFEGRGGNISSIENAFQMEVKVKPTADINKVYQINNQAWAWSAGSPLTNENWTLTNGTTVKGDAYLPDSPTLVSPFANYASTGEATSLQENYTKASYNNGVMTGHIPGGVFIGDSLLVVGDEARVTSEITNGSTTTAATGKVFNIDNDEREVDVKLSPSLINANPVYQSTVDPNSKDTVYITTTIPAKIKYKEGTALYGNKKLEPTITNNPDGSQTLKWTIKDVVLNSNMDNLTFAVNLGNPTDLVNDVQNLDTYDIKTLISADMDTRNGTAINGNLTASPLSIVKSNQTLISKDIDKTLYEVNEPISFNVYYGNDTQSAINSFTVLDVLPYNGDNRGSNFTGNYKLNTLSVTGGTTDEMSSWKLYYTTDTANKTLVANQVDTSSWSEATIDLSNPDMPKFTINANDSEKVVAIALQGQELGSKKVANLKVTIEPNGNHGKDVYGNQGTGCYGNSGSTPSASVITSRIVKAKVAERKLSGVAWLDKNINGIRENGETLLSNRPVQLFKEGVQVNENLRGENLDNITTNSDGYYEFTALPEGTYEVRFTDITKDDYKITLQNAGTDDTIDSDAQYISDISTNGGYGDIEALKLPRLEDIGDTLIFELPHNDVGIYKSEEVTPPTPGIVTPPKTPKTPPTPKTPVTVKKKVTTVIKKVSLPKTGDLSDIILLSSLSILGLGAIVIISKMRKRKYN
ncbi:MAG: hypothetical protein LBM02_01895 [Lachnospiraceae bacterium]|jgi:hypothetical protein|nr:hypothetical protein [Lachnospiraceae bacterium]